MAVNGQQGVARSFPARQPDSRKVPKCPDHSEHSMEYDPDNDIWRCTQTIRRATDSPRCKRTARQKRKFGDLFDGDGDAPTVYRGELEIVKTDDDKVYLRLVGVNGMVDITAIMAEPT